MAVEVGGAPGPAVDRLGIGLAGLGRPYYIAEDRDAALGHERTVENMYHATAAVLDTCYAAGIRYIDTARSYGLAEDFVARWLQTHPSAGDVTVASKWGYRYVSEWGDRTGAQEVKDHTLEAFRRQWDATRATLGDNLNIYQVHSLTPDSPVLTSGQTQGALSELREDGVLIGFSTTGPDQAETIRLALEIAVDGVSLFSVVQSTWNLFEQTATAALREAAAAGVTVVVKEVLANGRLSGTNPDSAVVETVARSVALDVPQFAIAAALRQPWATRVLSGALTSTHVSSAVAASAAHIPTGVVSAALERFEEASASYWDARSRRPWS